MRVCLAGSKVAFSVLGVPVGQAQILVVGILIAAIFSLAFRYIARARGHRYRSGSSE